MLLSLSYCLQGSPPKPLSKDFVHAQILHPIPHPLLHPINIPCREPFASFMRRNHRMSG